MSEPLIPLIQSMLGGALIGAVLSFVLYGVTVAQAFTYVKNCGEDPRLTKVLVFAVLSFDNVLDILPIPWLVFFDPFHRTVLEPSTKRRFPGVRGAYSSEFLRTFYMDSYVSNYARTLTILSLIIGLVLFVVARAVCVVFTYQANNWLEYQESRSTQLSVLFASVTLAIGDGIIASTLIFYLSRSRSGVKSQYGGAHNAGVDLNCYHASNLTYAGMTAIGCRTYANALLGMLNARKKLRSHLHHAPHVTRPRTQDGKTQISVESDCSVQSYVSEPRPIEIYREITSETYTDSMIAAGSIGVIPRTHVNRGSWMSAAGIPAPVRGSGLRRI
ncbi:hypothetical protein K474DRAFT_1680595 [Panus rudis PR-1116 ss-1]|nr:hypothetical protein K474DRAFT_1680595 [Panus rudis PR-1116 ss-1]